MDDNTLIEIGLREEGPLKVILGGWTEPDEHQQTVGIVGLLYVTTDVDKAEHEFQRLRATFPDRYYMVYSVPYDTDLSTLNHWPSLEITQQDLT
ncbi:MAG TPA: hypothetical protein DCW31_09615 [Lactobacillus sp.]|nr:hypothetical protein [Lactobacillus sp.]